LTPWELRGLLERIFECYPVQEGAELSIEIDPAVTTAEHLSELRALGFNRLSIGVQDFSEEVQDAVGRYQGASVTYETYTEARELGFGSINVDLMYGLPKQTIAHVTRSVDRVIDMGVDRVAVFGYAHVPWLKPHQRRLEIYGLPDSQTRWLMSEAAREKLLDAGYVAIGMDHFAKPNDEIVAAYKHGRLNRNFQGYTVMNTTDLLGLGAPAISDISGTYLQNRVRLGDYMSAVENGRFATVKGVRRSADDNLRSWLIKSIMCHLRIDYDDAHARFGVNVPKDFADALAQLAPLEDDGVVKRLDDALVVTEPGRLLVRNVASAFDAYLDSRSPAESQFSKAI
ncbi:MAG: oxygen-independent coproporphyrinogen III oxidase, partial [Planctomycetales bacterium]|nr:oxygen-independent coproporphyrinogen III oxidase [Planctomycetales bacterium]